MQITQIFKILLAVMLLSLSFIASSEPLLPTEPPFWKTKEKVYRKIKEQREIIVSVTAREDKSTPDTPNLLRMLGGGTIRVPAEFAFEQAKKFENLTKMSSHIKEVRREKQPNRLYIHTEAFNWHAQMYLQVSFKESELEKSLDWEIVDGHFKGMQGRITFTHLTAKLSEIGLTTGYRYKKLPLPTFFIEFGLEVVLQKVAARMRSFIEEQYGSKSSP